MKKTYILLFLSFACLFTDAQVGKLDPTFGENGIKELKYISKGSLVSDKGESFSVEVTNSSYNPTIRVYKYLSNGLFDISYGTNGFTEFVQMIYFGSEIQDDGKIVVVGSVHSPFGPIHDQIRIVRFNTDGTLDFVYTSPSPGTYYNFPVKLVKQGNQILLYGYSVSYSVGNNIDLIYSVSSPSKGVNVFSISPLRTNGKVGLSLNATSLSKNVAIEGNQLIVAGLEIIESETFPYTANVGYYVTKYVNGSLDPGFGTNGRLPETLTNENYSHMLLTSEGKVMIASAVANQSTGNSDFFISRFNKNGSPDLTFNGNGTQTTDFGSNDSAYLLAVQDDKLIVAGSTQNNVTGDKEFAFARYNNDGTLDKSFDSDGKQTLGRQGYSFFLQQINIEENRLLLSGTTISNSGETSKIVAAYLLKENILITCPADTTVNTNKGLCSAVVPNIDPTITSSTSNTPFTYTMSGVTNGNGDGSVSGKTFNKGKTIVSYQLLTDPSKTCSFAVTVEDKEAPVIKQVSASPNYFLLANHQMRDVQINYNISDNCGIVEPVLTVSSNEPESGTDKYDLPNDWKIIDAHHVQLRAEHTEKSKGRVYTIAITGTDAAGNKSEQQVKVSVPNSVSEIKKALINLIVKLLSNPSTNFFTLSIQSNYSEPVSIRVVDVF
jgi:uncharacterized delta-60 repeat protein